MHRNQSSSVIEEEVNLFATFGIQTASFKTLLIPGFGPIVVSQFLKVYLSTFEASVGKIILTLSKG